MNAEQDFPDLIEPNHPRKPVRTEQQPLSLVRRQLHRVDLRIGAPRERAR